jgi:hypothetical protein
VRCYQIRRPCFKCQKCRGEFSVTSKTVFAFRKMPFRDILTGLWLSVNSVKGKSALQLSRELGCQYKAAWVFLMKMREAIATRREDMRSKRSSKRTSRAHRKVGLNSLRVFRIPRSWRLK